MNRATTVLVAIDFSPSSAAALRRAIHIAAWTNAELTALHVVPSYPSPVVDPLGPMDLGAIPPVETDLAAEGRGRLEQFVRTHGAPASTRTIVEVGSPRDHILEAARRLRPAVLVMGAHGSHDGSRGVGTTAAACAQRAPMPVLLVREGQEGTFKSVLACVDFTDTSRLVLDRAVEVAAADAAPLHILTVYTDPWSGRGVPEPITRNMPDFADRYRRAVEARLRSFCEPLAPELAALKPQFHAVQSSTHAEGITTSATRQGCDLVVLGTRSTWTMRDFLWGSTAERVAREAPCSVLAVKPPKFDAVEPYQPLADSAAAIGRMA